MPEPTTVLKDIGEIITEVTEPVWAGPCSNHPQGGISQSLIGDWLACRERFRVHVIEGLSAVEGFSAPLEFGNLFHCAEEAYAKRAHKDDILANHNASDWVRAIEEYYLHLCNTYPFDRDQCRHWYMMCLALFPRYIDWWNAHHDLSDRVPLLSETLFRLPYRLPSGRTAYLRGKIDSGDFIRSGPEMGAWVQENKTKSTIDGQKLERQLTFDLQSMFYSIAFQWMNHHDEKGIGLSAPAMRFGQYSGVRYNVIKRPAHKSIDNMIKALTESIEAGRANEWFWRRNVAITEQDIQRFRSECLDPVLENISDDYEWWVFCFEHKVSQYDIPTRHREFKHHQNRHFRLPYGTYNPITEVWGGFGDVDEYLKTGSMVGLTRVMELFPELKEEKDGTINGAVTSGPH